MRANISPPLSRRMAVAAVLACLAPAAALAADRTALERDSRNAYQALLSQVPVAKALSKDAVAVLVFPKITKAGLGIGGQYGEGVLLKDGKPAGYYKTTGMSYGLQAGAQQYGYAMCS
jgi:lipid-binding SYLF domain-containing protein